MYRVGQIVRTTANITENLSDHGVGIHLLARIGSDLELVNEAKHWDWMAMPAGGDYHKVFAVNEHELEPIQMELQYE